MSEETPTVEPAAAPTDVVEEQKPVVAPTEPTTTSVPEKDITATATTPLAKLFKELPAIIKEADHNEMWGVTLGDESHIPTTIVLEKYLRANTNDVSKAKAQLTEALKWRKRMEPSKLLEAEYDSAKFGDLGYVTTFPAAEGKSKEIITWNIYGAVKDIKATFGDVQEYATRKKTPNLGHLY
jgi:phosphatidylinositol transfer protein SFH5